MADIEPSPTGNTCLPPLTSQFPQWSRATPLASLPPHLRSDGINGFLRVGNLILPYFFYIFFCFCAQFKKTRDKPTLPVFMGPARACMKN